MLRLLMIAYHKKSKELSGSSVCNHSNETILTACDGTMALWRVTENNQWTKKNKTRLETLSLNALDRLSPPRNFGLVRSFASFSISLVNRSLPVTRALFVALRILSRSDSGIALSNRELKFFRRVASSFPSACKSSWSVTKESSFPNALQ